MKKPTVYCFGHISTGKLYRIKNEYPQANGYAEIIDITENYCGEALGTAIVLQNLGFHTELEGNWIGDNDAGKRTLKFIENLGIGSSGILIKKGYQGVNELVISDDSSRTVFGRYGDLFSGKKQWELPSKNKIIHSDIVCSDPSFGDESLFVYRCAVENNIPYISIDVKYDSEYLQNSNVIIVSEDFIKWKYPNQDLKELFQLYLKNTSALVIFTFGKDPLWYGRNSIKYFQPFEIKPIDTAGAGDAFRAGVVFGIFNNYSDYDIVKFASAVSAVAISTYPGVINFPGINEVNSILVSNNKNYEE